MPWFFEVAVERDYDYGEFGSIPNNLKERHIRPFYDLLCAHKLMPYTEFLQLIRTYDSCWLSAHSEVSHKKLEAQKVKAKSAAKKR